jgi:hypothetical protein
VRQFTRKDLARVIEGVLDEHRALYGDSSTQVLMSLGRLVDDWNAPCVIPRVQVLKTLEEFERIIEAPPVKLSSRSPCDPPLEDVVAAQRYPRRLRTRHDKVCYAKRWPFGCLKNFTLRQGDHRDQLRLAASAQLRKVLRIRKQSIAWYIWLSEAEVFPPVTAA